MQIARESLSVKPIFPVYHWLTSKSRTAGACTYCQESG